MKLIDRIKSNKRVESVHSEFGNLDPDKPDWWVSLKSGWRTVDGVHSIHEQTLSDCYTELRKRVEPCDCSGCRHSLKEEQALAYEAKLAKERLDAAASEMYQALQCVVLVYRDDEETLRLGRPVLYSDAPNYARKCLKAVLAAGGLES